MTDLSTEGTMDAAGGHGGGDAGLMDAFIAVVATGDPGLVKSGSQESLTSHLTVPAAERARHDNTVEGIRPPTCPRPLGSAWCEGGRERRTS
ncbi:hypothetical protein OG612_02300 [Streptomyces sp. NBC_01527]|uniref:hypothetical protein n=1 Tax=Streptomyces sp. NBC_01527 TaxID=2903894 RepID=UPI0038670D17